MTAAVALLLGPAALVVFLLALYLFPWGWVADRARGQVRAGQIDARTDEQRLAAAVRRRS